MQVELSQALRERLRHVFAPSETEGLQPRFPFGRRVLITEDNWLIACEWQAELEGAGYTVAGIAVSADEAIAMCGAEAPDFVLMDVRLLGDRDGVDAAIAIRRTYGARSVFITAHDELVLHKRAEAAEPIGWLTKPVVPARLPELLLRLARPASS
jgi:CheY-like chemotaxis protein